MKALNHYFDHLLLHLPRFVVGFFALFVVHYGLLYLVDFLPEPVSDTAVDADITPIDAASVEGTLAVAVIEETIADTSNLVTDTVADWLLPSESEATVEPGAADVSAAAPAVVTTAAPVLPTAVYFATLDRTVEILNPADASIAALDAALLEGAVRHPNSAALNQDGNVFILGHSSYLPTVMNRNFQAFNGIQNLAWGDTIEVTAADATYVYQVDKVYHAKASELVVPITDTGRRLTLATCNSFGSVDDRYIVEASFVGTKSA